jgi:hypothetical protein
VDDPQPIAEPIEEALLRILRPDLLTSYRQERDRHNQEKQAIEDAMRRARNLLWQCFQEPIREQKEEELQAEYLERVPSEDDRHDRALTEIREVIRDYLDEDRGI